MNRFDSSLSLKGLFSGENRKTTLILLVSTVVMIVWKYYGTKDFYAAHLSAYTLFNNPDWTGSIFSFFTGLVLFGLVPIIIIKSVFHEPLSRYGVQIGDARFGWLAVLVMAPVMIALTYPSANNPQFLAQYPLFKGATASAGIFAGHSMLLLMYYLGYEMLMRGFIQFGLREQLGDWNAILVQTAVSTLFHIGKPDGEIFSAILGGIIWGIVVFRSRSLLYVLIVHWLLGVSLEYFCCLAH